ncbi:MAG TPA: amidohydrolase family protein [Candidatus Sulfopaludibacter sp.]|nr:amidohydrolase family protein [Candidatus Sulfopaludibacter sp.]
MRGSRGARRGPDLNELTIIGDGAILICDGVIKEVGPSRRLENLAGTRDAIEINAAGRVVMPGFVDSHTHLAFPLGDSADPAEDIRAVRSSTGARVAVRARSHLEAMARHGTTTVEVKTGCGPDETAETKLLRVLNELRSEPIDLISTFLFQLPGEDLDGAHNAAAEWVFSDLMPKIRRRRLAGFADVAWNANPTSHCRSSRFLQVARQLGFGCRIHADAACAGAAILMGMEHLVAAIDHLEHATPEDAARLGAGSSVATLLPSAAFHQETPFAPARALIDSGAAVALASNFNPIHTPAWSMQTAVALACRYMKMTPAEAITAATFNGAYALGRSAQCGSLEPGKAADILILNVPDYRDVARHFGDNLVHLTMKRGVIIYQEGGVARLPDSQLRLSW